MTKADVKVSAGDKAIAAALAGKATNGEFLKALWSIRGDLKVRMASSDLKLNVVKADLVNLYKGLPDDKASEFRLVKDGSVYEVAPVKVKAPKAEKPAPAPAPAGAAGGETSDAGA
jgi:hypothetical protein